MNFLHADNRVAIGSVKDSLHIMGRDLSFSEGSVFCRQFPDSFVLAGVVLLIDFVWS